MQFVYIIAAFLVGGLIFGVIGLAFGKHHGRSTYSQDQMLASRDREIARLRRLLGESK